MDVIQSVCHCRCGHKTICKAINGNIEDVLEAQLANIESEMNSFLAEEDVVSYQEQEAELAFA